MSKTPSTGGADEADTLEAQAFRRVCEEARALQAGCGLNELLAAVRTYGDFMRMAGAAGAAEPEPTTQPAVEEPAGADQSFTVAGLDDLDRVEKWLIENSHRSAFFPRDAQTLANIAANVVREIRVLRAAPHTAWLPMESAPKDGTLVRLLVAFTECATEDTTEPTATIGANSHTNTGVDEWKFAGWNWTHDCFDQGEGTPVGWLPLLDFAPASAASTGPAPTETMGTLRITHWPTGPEWAFEPTEGALQLAPGEYPIFAAGSAPAADDEDDGITQAQWLRAAERLLEAFGDSEKDAAEIARHLWDEQDHHSGEIGDPREQALQFIEERPDAPDRLAARRYQAIRDLPWVVNFDHTGDPDSIEINIACEGDRAATPSDGGAELDRIADAMIAVDEPAVSSPFIVGDPDEIARRVHALSTGWPSSKN